MPAWRMERTVVPKPSVAMQGWKGAMPVDSGKADIVEPCAVQSTGRHEETTDNECSTGFRATAPYVGWTNGLNDS